MKFVDKDGFSYILPPDAELEMMRTEDEIHRDEMRTRIGYFVVGFCVIVATCFSAWVYSLVR